LLILFALSAALMSNKAADLSKLEAEFQKLTLLKQELDAKAARSGTRWTWGVTGAVTLQGIIMARLIWWDLSWDVMEPIAYLLSFSYMTFGWAYFVVARDDIAEYGTLAGKYINSAKRKLYAKAGLSEEAYKALEAKIAEHKRNLKLYGVVPANERKDYPIPHGVLRESLQHAPGGHPVTAQKQ
jgi:calcium uniporter protein, mitochondrial